MLKTISKREDFFAHRRITIESASTCLFIPLRQVIPGFPPPFPSGQARRTDSCIVNG